MKKISVTLPDRGEFAKSFVDFYQVQFVVKYKISAFKIEFRRFGAQERIPKKMVQDFLKAQKFNLIEEFQSPKIHARVMFSLEFEKYFLETVLL